MGTIKNHWTMLKRTLHLGNPAHLSVQNKQLLIELKDENRSKHSVPFMDIGMIIMEHPHITLSSSVMEQCMYENIALIACNKNYMPVGMFLPFDGHSEQTQRLIVQTEISLPLKKQLWQQTIKAKIKNQALVLSKLGKNNHQLLALAEKVLSGDSTNCEGHAAFYYWNEIFGTDFSRSQSRETPNAQLNYGYAILRSIVARAISSTGLHPSLGIFHRNKYNAFCLADDLMEPYRAFVDLLVLEIIADEASEELTRTQKIELLKLPQIDVMIGKLKRPLFHAVSHTTAGLYKCFVGKNRKIPYPTVN